MHVLVTGAAGFIGSHLVERFLAEGHRVRGVDAFTPYYDPEVKRSNVAGLLDHDRFELIGADLRTADLDELLEGVAVVAHLAGQPGVRPSWDEGFGEYVGHNVNATQRLLEACRRRGGLDRFVYASSSSVYGNAADYPTTEVDLPMPHSPYGVTKLAAEHLCCLYADNFALPTVSLRYFTVYGPRQRPEMAVHRLVESALDGTLFPLFGDGRQVRDFTYVDDVVDATYRAAVTEDVPAGLVANVAGGDATTMMELIGLVESVTGRLVHLDRLPPAPGDVDRTGGTIDVATDALGWRPSVRLAEGVARQAEWHVAARVARA